MFLAITIKEQNSSNTRKLYYFKTMLERLIWKEKTGFKIFNNHELPNIIQSALEKCKRAENRKSESNCCLENAWFDEEGKMARRTLKKEGKEKMNEK